MNENDPASDLHTGKSLFPQCIWSLAALALFFSVQSGIAQVQPEVAKRPRITQTVDESSRATLKGNTRPEVRSGSDRGAVADSFRIDHMQLQLRRSRSEEQALQVFIDELHTQGSPNFHQWISAQEFGQRFGLAQQDLDTITGWLESHGFVVNVVYPSGMLIDFSGSAGQVRQAFQTEIHNLEANGERHIANVSDPQIPAALAPAVAGIVSLHDFRPHTMHHLRNAYADYTFNGLLGAYYALVPADLATIYNLNPLFGAGYSGQGQTIAVIENTNLFSTSDWNTFRSTFGLSNYGSGALITVHPAPTSGTNNCTDPGVVGSKTSPNDAEAVLDAEWASAAAPSATIELASCADTTTTFGGLIAVQNLINSTVPPPIMSISYGQCETQNGAAANAAYSSAYQQAVTEGVSIFVAAGDSGAAGCDNGVTEATNGIAVSGFASTPYNVAVGGTDFSDTYSKTNSTYWSSSNTPSFGSAFSYIPEIPWDDSCANALVAKSYGYNITYGPNSLCNSLVGPLVLSIAAGGGGPSGCATGAPSPSTSSVVSGTCKGWPKPIWQSILGNPGDNVRDLPDVSLFAGDGIWGHYYVFCWSDTANGGADCTGAPSGWSGAGGTSFAAPIMAGIQALVNQKAGGSQGNPNPAYYQLAAAEDGISGSTSCNSSNGNTAAGNCVFYDVTQGDIDVDCTGTANCFLGGSTVGVLSTSTNSFSPAFGTTVGWDFATGLGSVNAYNLVNNWPASTPNFRLSASPSSLTVLQGTSGQSTITVVPYQGFGSSVGLSASGLPNGVTASFSPTSTTSTSTLTLTVGTTATPGTITVTVTGTSGIITNTTQISLTIAGRPTAVVSFVKADTTTQGNWKSAYGADGYNVIGNATAYPSYATVTPNGQSSYVWASSTTDIRALQKATSTTDRIAATWYAASSFSIDVNLTDGKSHQVALYALDWDNRSRAEAITIADAGTATVLDSRNISSFVNGEYLVWNISGHVTITVTLTGGLNPVISGLFFGGPPVATSVVQFVKADTTTEGNWKSAYGADGYNVVGNATAYPAYATVTPNGQSSYVWAASTTDIRALQKATSTTDRIAATWYASSFSIDVNLTDGNTHQIALYALDWDSLSRAETISVADAATATVLDSRNISSFVNGEYLVWNISGHVTITVTQTGGANGVISGIFFGGPPVPTAGAQFVKTDTTTQGNWKSAYGAEGYNVVGDVAIYPSYATVTPSGQSSWVWASSTTAVRALQKATSTTDRVAATWYASSSFSIDVNVTDGKSHQIALYALDWDNLSRAETVTIADAATATVLDSRSISSFVNGEYLVWNISGHVIVTLTRTGGSNGVISGVFFGGPPATPTSSTQFVKTDTTTQGNWKGTYGSNGYNVIGDTTADPAFATVIPSGQSSWVWASSTTDIRALQKASSTTDRIAATWYSSPSFSIDVSLTDGKTHQIALYALDWDTISRAETITIVDASTHVVLDSRNISSFSNGEYLVWNISGHVNIVVTCTGGLNAVISGIFF